MMHDDRDFNLQRLCPCLQASSYSSLEDSVDRDLSRQSSICLDNGFPLMPGEGEKQMGETGRSL